MTHKNVRGILSAIGYGNKLSIESFEIVEEALNKQVPMTPKRYGDGYADGDMVYDMWECPNCGQSYELDHDEYDYCPCCGQAIDWPEDDE